MRRILLREWSWSGQIWQPNRNDAKALCRYSSIPFKFFFQWSLGRLRASDKYFMRNRQSLMVWRAGDGCLWRVNLRFGTCSVDLGSCFASRTGLVACTKFLWFLRNPVVSPGRCATWAGKTQDLPSCIRFGLVFIMVLCARHSRYRCLNKSNTLLTLRWNFSYAFRLYPIRPPTLQLDSAKGLCWLNFIIH